MYKTVQINYCRKVLCVTAWPCVLTSVPLTYGSILKLQSVKIWRKSRTKCSFWCSHVSRLASLVCPWLRRVYGGSCKTCPFVSCVICSSRMACMSWKALLAARHCVATPVLLSRRENRIGAMTLFHCSTIGLSINIFTSCHNRYFNIVIFHIRVSIRVRGLHLVFIPYKAINEPGYRYSNY